MTREQLTICEGCERPIYIGDKYHPAPDVSLCFECAPTYQDILDEPEAFLDKDENPLTHQQAREIIQAHTAKGGKLSDKVCS